MVFDCQHAVHRAGRGYVVIVSINGMCSWLLMRKASTTDAAYIAQKLALRMAKGLGVSNIVIRNASRHVTLQLRNIWQARKPITRAHLADCRRLASGMTVTYM